MVKKLALFAFVLYLNTLSCFAQPGTFDASFGIDGKMNDELGTAQFLLDLALQPDGKIVGVGQLNFNSENNEFFVVRYNSDGSKDTEFGIAGLNTTLFGVSSGANTVALQSDGKIVVAGFTSSQHITNGITTSYKIMAVRYNSDGTLDTTFNTTGIFTFANEWTGYIKDIAIQEDGKIVMAGSMGDRPVLVRLNEDGTLDTSFAETGYTNNLPVGGWGTPGIYNKLKICSDGSIVAAGRLGIDMLLSKYNSDGTLYATFGNQGVVMVAGLPNTALANGLTITSNDDILLSGEVYNGDLSDGVVAKFNENGVLVTDFADNGFLITNLGTGMSMSGIEVAMSNNKIVVGYLSGTIYNYDFTIAAYHLNGNADTSFGTNGSTTFFFDDPVRHDYLRSMIVQPDGKILVGGRSWGGISIGRLYGVSDETADVSKINKNKFILYPNPVKKGFNIQATNIYSTKQIQIFNILGVRVHEQEFIGSNAHIESGNLPAGIYTAIIKHSGGTDVLKFTVIN